MRGTPGYYPGQVALPDNSFQAYQGRGHQIGGDDSQFYQEGDSGHMDPGVDYMQRIQAPKPMSYNPPKMQLIDGEK